MQAAEVVSSVGQQTALNLAEVSALSRQHMTWWCDIQKNLRRPELSISKNTPDRRLAQGLGHCRHKVRGRFAFPSA